MLSEIIRGNLKMFCYTPLIAIEGTILKALTERMENSCNFEDFSGKSFVTFNILTSVCSSKPVYYTIWALFFALKIAKSLLSIKRLQNVYGTNITQIHKLGLGHLISKRMGSWSYRLRSCESKSEGLIRLTNAIKTVYWFARHTWKTIYQDTM